MDRLQLRDNLMTVFNREEMAALCLRLGLDYVELSGKTHRDKVSMLIGTLDRNGRLPELVRELVRERPHLEPTYSDYLASETAVDDDRLSWLDRLAAGEGPAVEEPPTMRWDTDVPPLDDENE